MLDTNVVISALLWPGTPTRFIDLASEGEAHLFISRALLDELSETLLRPKFARAIAATALDATTLVKHYQRLTHFVTARQLTQGCQVILAVPCCQHELAPQIEADALSPLLRHGLWRERFGSLATDGLRAVWLEAQGYRTQIVEFIEMEHTPKNVLLRGVRSESPRARETAAAEYAALKRFLGIGATYLDGLPIPGAE